MTSIVSILETLSGLIQQINKVKVCQEHMQLVATSLIQLQYGLSNNDAIDDRRSLEDIAHTLKVIDEVIIGCTENEAELKGMTYRDLEILLLRLHSRLAQHEANLTDDYRTKVQILSNAHHEQQIFVQKVFDEKIRNRLSEIEQQTKQQTIEQLHLLREQYFNTINIYLRYCVDLHKSVPLTGLTGGTVATVAHNFYHISTEQQIWLERNLYDVDG
jgi:hypothetical protein